MATERRLKKEYKDFQKDPPTNVLQVLLMIIFINGKHL